MNNLVCPVFLDGVVLAYGFGVLNRPIHVNLPVAAHHGDDVCVIASWILLQMTANTLDLLDVLHVCFSCKCSVSGKCRIVIEASPEPTCLFVSLSVVFRNVVEVLVVVTDGGALMVVLFHNGQESSVPETSWIVGILQELDASLIRDPSRIVNCLVSPVVVGFGLLVHVVLGLSPDQLQWKH